MQYRTSIPTRQAVALKPLVAPLPTVDQDVYAGLASKAAVDLDRQAQMANAKHMQNALRSQTQMATQGLGQVATARQNAMDLSQARRDAASSYINGILSGLFR